MSTPIYLSLAPASPLVSVILRGPAGPASAGIAADAIWQASGDLVQGTGSGTATRLPIGLPGQVPAVNSGGTALEYQTISGSGDVTAAAVLPVNSVAVADGGAKGIRGLVMAASTIVARLASGDTVAATVAQIRSLLGLGSAAYTATTDYAAAISRRHAYAAPHSYCGRAPAGTAEAAESWTITKITVATDGSVTLATASGVAWIFYSSASYA